MVLCLISPVSFVFADEAEAPIDATTPQVETTVEEEPTEDKAPIEESVQEETPQPTQEIKNTDVEPTQKEVEKKTEGKVEEKVEEKTEEKVEEKIEEKVEIVQNTPQSVKRTKTIPQTEEETEEEYTVTYTYRVWDQWQECEQGNLLSEETHSQNYKVGEEVWMPSIVSNGQYYFPLPGHPQEVLWAHAGTVLEGGGNPEDLGAEFIYPDGYLIPKMIAENVDLVYNYGPLYDTISCEDYLQDDDGEYQLTNSRNYRVAIGNNVQLKSKEIEGYTFNESLSNLIIHVTLRTIDDSIFKLTRYWDKVKTEEPIEEEPPEEIPPTVEETVEEPVVSEPTKPTEPTKPVIVKEKENEKVEVKPTEPIKPIIATEIEETPISFVLVLSEPITEHVEKKAVKTNSIPPVPQPIITDNPVQEPKEFSPPTINEPPIPLAKPIGAWALINLIALVLSIIIALILSFAKKQKAEDEEEYTEEDKSDISLIRIIKGLSLFFAIISFILFILTEDMRLPMILIDKWTIIMILILIVEIINIFIIKSHTEQNNEED